MRIRIRTATMDDLDKITKLEAICFPEAEAASRLSFMDRLTYYPNHFWLMEDEGEIIGFVNGMVTNQEHLSDEMYDHANLHDEEGAWQMIFGVDTAPQHRCKGYAGMIIEYVISKAREQGRKGLVLTCKDKLVPYYEKFGFMDEGISESEHGGVSWHEMRMHL